MNHYLFDRDLPEFKAVMDKIKSRFWRRHEQIKEELESKGLYPFDEYLK